MPMARQQRSAPPEARRPRSGLRPVPLLAGLGVSAALHILVIVLYSSLVRIEIPDVVVIPVSVPSPEPEGMQVVQIIEVATPETATPDEPTPTEEISETQTEVERPAIETEFDPFPPELYRSAGERLRLGAGDPRLWQPIDPSLVEPTPEQVHWVRLATLIAEGNDSALAEAQALARATDWTYTDADGKRWGFSPGMIHLGDVSIPLPFGFSPPYDYNGERAQMAFRLNDIQRAAGTLAARQSWRERVEAMRKRREERRAEEQAARVRPRPVTKPDTSFSSPRNKSPLHSAGDASGLDAALHTPETSREHYNTSCFVDYSGNLERRSALLLLEMALPILVVAPCQPGASPPSVRRGDYPRTASRPGPR